VAKQAAKPSPARLWPVALQGKERKSRGGKRGRACGKVKERTARGHGQMSKQPYLQIPFCSPFFFLLLSSAPQSPLVRLIFKTRPFSVCSDLCAPEEKKDSKKGERRERRKKTEK